MREILDKKITYKELLLFAVGLAIGTLLLKYEMYYTAGLIVLLGLYLLSRE